MSIYDANGDPVEYMTLRPEQLEANACLVAAAPEMAAILREFIRLGDTNEMNPGALHDLYGAACCVMAKAQGEDQ
mgnify:FL=1